MHRAWHRYLKTSKKFEAKPLETTSTPGTVTNASPPAERLTKEEAQEMSQEIEARMELRSADAAAEAKSAADAA